MTRISLIDIKRKDYAEAVVRAIAIYTGNEYVPLGDEGEYYVATEYLTAEEPELTGHLIAINAGHQEKANEGRCHHHQIPDPARVKGGVEAVSVRVDR